jgi:hypothetical protein
MGFNQSLLIILNVLDSGETFLFFVTKSTDNIVFAISFFGNLEDIPFNLICLFLVDYR